MIADPGPSRTTGPEPLAYRVVRGGLWVALSSYFTHGFGFLANLALTRLLAPEDYGVVALATFFSALIGLRPKLAVNQAFAQRQETTGELVGTHMVLDVSAAAATVALALLAVPLLRALGYSQDVAGVVLALAVVGVAEALLSTASILLDRELHFGRTSLVSSLAFPLSYVPAFWLALHGGRYWSLVAQTATYALLLLGGMWWAAGRQLPAVFRLRWRFDRAIAGDLLRFGGLVGLGTLAAMLVTQFDSFLVGTYVGLATLGFYDRARRIAQWPSLLVSSVLARTAFYTYARLQNDAERLAKSVTMTCWLLALLAIPIALAVFVSAPDLVALLYGERWLPSAPFVRFLVVYSLLRPLVDLAGSLLVAVGRPQRATAIYLLQLGTLAIVGLPLTLAHGAIGTCIGVGLAFVAGASLAYRYVRQATPASFLDTLGLPGLAAAAVALVGWRLGGVSALGLWPRALRVSLAGGLALAAFYALLLIVQRRRFIGRLAYVWRLLLAREVVNGR